MNRSESIAALAAALAKAQGVMAGAKKDSANPHFKSKYADLASIWDACRDALSANGIAVVQAPGTTESGMVSMTTMLCHASGEWISETLTIPIGKADAQGYGSATTYARRYALAAMVGIAPEDDDGNAASRPALTPDREDRIDDGQRGVLTTLAEQAGTDMKAFCTYYKIGALPELPASRFAHAKATLTKKRDEKAPEREAA